MYMPSFFKQIITVFLLCTLILSFPGCTEVQTDSGNGISVVTTNFALYDFASAVCGVEDTVTMLLPLGAESHDYEVTLQDMAILEKCDLLFFVGGESEAWVIDALHTLEEHGSAPATLSALDVLSEADKLLCEESVNSMTAEESHNHDHDHDHNHDSYAGIDEHVWTSIPSAILLMDALDGTLSRLNENHIPNRHEDYAASLSALDEKFRTLTENTADPRIIVADRFPFLYMVKEYGIGYYAAFSGCTSDTEPSVAIVNTLIRETEETGTDTLFVIEFSNRKTAELIAAQTGADIAELHSCHNVSAADFRAGITYLDLMERNYAALSAAWNTANLTQD